MKGLEAGDELYHFEWLRWFVGTMDAADTFESRQRLATEVRARCKDPSTDFEVTTYRILAAIKCCESCNATVATVTWKQSGVTRVCLVDDGLRYFRRRDGAWVVDFASQLTDKSIAQSLNDFRYLFGPDAPLLRGVRLDSHVATQQAGDAAAALLETWLAKSGDEVKRYLAELIQIEMDEIKLDEMEKGHTHH